MTRRSEGGAGELFGIKPERWPLRAVAAFRQRSFDRLRFEMTAEAGHVGSLSDHVQQLDRVPCKLKRARLRKRNRARVFTEKSLSAAST